MFISSLLDPGMSRFSGLSCLFGLLSLFGFPGSSNKTNQIDQTSQTTQTDPTRSERGLKLAQHTRSGKRTCLLKETHGTNGQDQQTVQERTRTDHYPRPRRSVYTSASPPPEHSMVFTYIAELRRYDQ